MQKQKAGLKGRSGAIGPETEKIIPEDKTINMSVIGDIMCHNSQYQDAYNSATDTYDFSYVFENVVKYI